MAERFQLRRTAGYRTPAGAVVVTRGSKRWGNPFRVGDTDIPDRATAVARYEQHLAEHPELVERIRVESAGRDLACSCPLDDGRPCHADVMLRVANPAPAR